MKNWLPESRSWLRNCDDDCGLELNSSNSVLRKAAALIGQLHGVLRGFSGSAWSPLVPFFPLGTWFQDFSHLKYSVVFHFLCRIWLIHFLHYPYLEGVPNMSSKGKSLSNRIIHFILGLRLDPDTHSINHCSSLISMRLSAPTVREWKWFVLGYIGWFC
jgi:hypothetical protein